MNIRKLAQLLVCICAGTAIGRTPGCRPGIVATGVGGKRRPWRATTPALRQYTWVEHTEVLIKGDVKNSTDALCRYDGWGEVQKKQIAGAAPRRRRGPGEVEAASTIERRPTCRTT